MSIPSPPTSKWVQEHACTCWRKGTYLESFFPYTVVDAEYVLRDDKKNSESYYSLLVVESPFQVHRSLLVDHSSYLLSPHEAGRWQVLFAIEAE
jgi:hypothetical protein